MSCPRCGFSEPGPVECPRCGVVFAKLERRPRPEPQGLPDRSPRSWSRPLTALDAALILVLVLAVVVVVLRRDPAAPPASAQHPVLAGSDPTASSPPPRAAPSTPEPPPDRPGGLGSSEGDLPSWAIVPPASAPPPLGVDRPPASAPRPNDQEDAAALSLRVAGRQPIESSHLDTAEALLSRNPGHAPTRRLLRELLWEAARQADERGRTATAQRCLQRATDLLPEEPAVWTRLIERHQGEGNWREAERTARRGLSELPDSSALHLALAQAISRQGRDREAADGLRRRLAARPDDTAARRELAGLDRTLESVAGLTHRTSAHFSVRFEGEANDALGRALLELLEEKYDMLAGILDCEPSRQIPVILLPRQTYSSVSSAPDWAAGYYSHSDARIRIGTRDLSPGFVPLDLERLLTHELAHAFIHARTGGAVPDDINEGLAQYLSGKRLGYRLDPRRAEVQDGRMEVNDFYDSALSFVEYLIGRYRQQRLNDLLKYAGETGSVDQAFRRAFQRTYDETREEWLKSLR